MADSSTKSHEVVRSTVVLFALAACAFASTDLALAQRRDLNRRLIDAVNYDNPSKVRNVLRRGANANATDGAVTALYCAVAVGDEAISQLLLEHGAKADFADEDGR